MDGEKTDDGKILLKMTPEEGRDLEELVGGLIVDPAGNLTKPIRDETQRKRLQAAAYAFCGVLFSLDVRRVR